MLQANKTIKFQGGSKMTNSIYPIGRFVFEGMTAAQKEEAILQIEQFPQVLRSLLQTFSEEELDSNYRIGSWTVRQAVHHICDFASHVLIRFKLALTENNPTIKPFLEDRWVALADSASLPIEPSLLMIDGIYTRLGALLRSMSVADFERQFYHPEKVTQMNLKFFLAFSKWHSYHHLAHIQSVREKLNELK